METKTKYLIFGTFAGLMFYIIIQILPFITCTNDLGCLVFMIIPQLLGFAVTEMLHINLPIIPLIIFNGILYSALGALIAWLIYYFKNKA